MKISTRMVLLLLLTTPFFNSFSQTVLSNETFPNYFNLSYTSPINQGFYEGIGKWIGYTPDSYSTVAVDSKKYSSPPFALRMANTTTVNYANETTCRATGPIINCLPPCATSTFSIQFKIFNLNVNPANDHFFLFVLVSSDNGSTWTTIAKKSAAELVTSYGSNKWSDATVAIPAAFYTSSLRYRFIGCQLPGSIYENCIYLDDIKIVASPCPTTSNLRLGNQVWNDRDGDGKRDDNEPAIGGITISLYTDNNSDNLPDGAAIKTVQSDAQGKYLFTDLPAGRYIASMPILPGYQQSPNTSTQATSPFPDNNIDNDDNIVRRVGPNVAGSILYTNAITLSAGQEPTTDGDDANGNLTFDLAECGNSGIGDFVWNDLNGNGIQDAGEPGINGVLVTITFEDGRTATVLTHNYNAANNANAPQYDGYYDFINLGPGTYKITFATPAGLHASPANVGDDTKDSDPVNGAAVSVTIAANQSNFTIDAGFTNFTPPTPTTCPNLSIGNKVFMDVIANGIKELLEPGIGGLTVKLYSDNDGNNLPDGAAISTITTDEDGTYYFGNLTAGRYIVGVTTGNGFSQSIIGDATPDDNKNNDNNGIRTVNGEVLSNFITLTAGAEPTNDGSDNNSNLTLDFGLKPLCGTHCDCHNDCNHVGCGHPNCGKSAQRIDDDSKTTMSVFPNPGTNYCQVKVNAVASGQGQVRITDATGNLVASKEVNLVVGTNNITFNDLGNLKSGSYNVQLLFNYQVYNQQLLLVK